MQFAGDYKLDSVVVHSASGSIDIKALMIELNVYESIHADNLYGSMVVADSANHVQNMPIIGQEDIEFKLSTNEEFLKNYYKNNLVSKLGLSPFSLIFFYILLLKLATKLNVKTSGLFHQSLTKKIMFWLIHCEFFPPLQVVII